MCKKGFSRPKICKFEDSIMIGLIYENSLLNYVDIVLFSSFGPIFPAIPPTIQGITFNQNLHMESVGIEL